MNRLLKVSLVLALVLLVSTTAFAKSKGSAYETGNIYLTGATNLNFGMGSDTMTPDEGDEMTTDHTMFGLGTRAGYFVIDGLEIGLGLNYDYDKAEWDATSTDAAGKETEMTMTQTNSTYLVGLQGAYFFDMDGIDPFVAVLVGFTGSSDELKPEEGDSTTDSTSGPGYDISLGVNFLLNKKVGLAPALYYTGTSESGSTETGSVSSDYDFSTSRYGLRVGINLFL